MKLFPATSDYLLDSASLPCTDHTEMNYRTRPLAPEEELRLTLLLLFVPVPCLILSAMLLNQLIALHLFFEKLTLAVFVLVVLRLLVLQLIGSPLRRELALAIAIFSVFVSGRLWGWMEGPGWCRVALFSSWFVCCLIARQVAAWILVGPTVDSETMKRWRVNLPGLVAKGYSFDCPELLTFMLSPLLLGPAWWLAAWVATAQFDRLWLWPWCFLGSLHVCWILLHVLISPLVPWPNWRSSWRVTFQALIVFATYDVHETPAAGVFRFPTRWLRSLFARWALITAALMSLAFACSYSCPSPVERFRQGGTLVGQAGTNLLAITVEAPVLLISILWFVAGTLLARFDRELSGENSDGFTAWDIYVDRIVNSADELEAEHILLGTTLKGDFPVLVHHEIYDQHVHLTGDSGASKSSLGVAPMATQLIARGDATVIVIDLKGDKALFEACRIEAARTRNMRFRWLTNEIGKSTFAFNPFLQSHNSRLSVEQFSQFILQGLSLDHGVAYGAGYFTAMNEIVLTTVLKNCQARSFRELDHYLLNQRFYAQFGHAEDWSHARHLGAIVSRMACTQAINVVPGMFPNQPAVLKDALDAAELFDNPQVVYLSLASAVEPSNAPAIARLFLWTLFNAASQRPQGSQRVYLFVDELQQLISSGIKLLFEQFRDLGGTIIGAHQTAAQLSRDGADLGETIDSCTAMKQIYRASDLFSLERLEKLSGSRLEQVANWIQPHRTLTGDLLDPHAPMHAEEGLINVRQIEKAKLDRSQLLKISSSRLASLVRFTFGSGYTQFAGETVPIVSQYPISFLEYQRRRKLPWPTAAGAFVNDVAWISKIK